MSVGTLTILCMGKENKRRRKGEGGLYIIHRKVWNELKQQDEIVEMYQATKEVDHPTDPFKRKTLSGTGFSAPEAQSRLNRSINRFYKKKGFQPFLPNGRSCGYLPMSLVLFDKTAPPIS